MIYVTSDLHGCPPDAFRQLLDQAGFSGEDTLYVLGDVIDRGTHGAELLAWLIRQPNVRLLMGNHEDILLSLAFLLEEDIGPIPDSLSRMERRMLENWLYNGGGPTLLGLQKIREEDPDLLAEILDTLRNLPLYATVQAGGKEYILCHAGLGNFTEDKPLSEYTARELLWVRPSLDTWYYPDKTVIFGHTPTAYYSRDYFGKALFTGTWICIDAGAAAGNMPMVLRLDDCMEFYAPRPNL